MSERLPAERWVSARITILVPLDVPAGASPSEKQEAVSRMVELIPLARNMVVRGEWEDCEVEAEDVPTIPPPPARRRPQEATDV